jgi:hypothetical protein
MKRKKLLQFVDRNRLIRRIEFDARDGSTLEILRRSRALALARRYDDGGKQQHEKHRRTHVPQ